MKVPLSVLGILLMLILNLCFNDMLYVFVSEVNP